MNPTIEKFGWPASLVHEFEHWLILTRPAQPTLGSLVLAAKSDATAFGDLPDGAHAELKEVSTAIERALGKLVSYEKLNYLMMMMVDPHVHFHVIPRYEGSREWSGMTFSDAGWPKTPELGEAIALDSHQLEQLSAWLAEAFG